MAKKQFNLDSLANELEQSAFFPARQSATTVPVVPERTVKPVEQPEQLDQARKNSENPKLRKPENPKTSFSPHPDVPATRFQFDPMAKADQKYTSFFTEEELERLEDIKPDVKRRFGHKTTKQEILRCALGDLIEDYQQHGDESRLVLRLKSRHHQKT